MNMSRRMIAFPPNEDIPAATQLSHSLVMLPSEVTVVKVCARPARLARCVGRRAANLLADLQQHALEIDADVIVEMLDRKAAVVVKPE